MGFFDKLKQGLSKTKQSFNDKVNNVFSAFRKVDEELLEELEEALIMSDVGVETSTKIIANLRDKIKKQNFNNYKFRKTEEMQKYYEDLYSKINPIQEEKNASIYNFIDYRAKGKEYEFNQYQALYGHVVYKYEKMRSTKIWKALKKIKAKIKRK